MLPRSPSRAHDEDGGAAGSCIHLASSDALCRVPAALDCLRGRTIRRREVVHPGPDPSGSHPVCKFSHAQLISARQDSRRQLNRAASFQLVSWSNLQRIVKLRRIEREETLEPLEPLWCCGRSIAAPRFTTRTLAPQERPILREQ